MPLLTDYVCGDGADLRYSPMLAPGILYPVAVVLLTISREPFRRRVQEMKRDDHAARAGASAGVRTDKD